MQISSAGNVGIGTTAPTYTLHVSGNGLFTSGLNVSGGGITASYSAGNGVIGNGVNGIFGIGSANGVIGNGPNGVTGKGSNIGVVGSGGTYGIYGTGGTYGVVGNGSTYGVYGNGGPYGVYANGTTNGVVGNTTNSGGAGVVGNGGAYGVYGTGSTYGVVGKGVGDGVGNVGTFGVYGSCDIYSPGTTGLYGEGYTGVYGAGYAYGVYGKSLQDGTYAGYFDGSVYSSGIYEGSDRKLKTNIVDFPSAMGILNKLHPKIFQYRQDGNFKLMNLPTGEHYGLIAQDVEEVIPGLIKNTKFETSMASRAAKDPSIASMSKGPGQQISQTTPAPTPKTLSETIDFKAVNYVELIPIMIKGMQEQQQEIEELKKLVEKIAPGQIKHLLTGNLTQNIPNPVNDFTRIEYSIPSNSNRAQLLLTDRLGRTIKMIQLTDAGYINVNTSSFSNGTYNYSLLVDGKIIETKNMIVLRK